MRIIQKIGLAFILLGGITLESKACFEGYAHTNFFDRYHLGLPNPFFKNNLNLSQQELLNSYEFQLSDQAPESVQNGQYTILSRFLGDYGDYEERFALYTLENNRVNGYALMELLLPSDPCHYEALKQSYIKDQVEVQHDFSYAFPSGFSLSLFEKRNQRFIFQTILLNTPTSPYDQPPYRAKSFVLVRAKYPAELEAVIKPRIQAYLTTNLEEFVFRLNQSWEPEED